MKDRQTQVPRSAATSRTSGRQAVSGAALLLVLGILTLLVTLAASLAFDSSLRFTDARSRAERLQAQYALRAGAVHAAFLLRSDRSNDQREGQEDGTHPTDDPGEPWGSAVHEIPVGDLVVRIRITDERARLPVNDLVDAQGAVQEAPRERMRRLLDSLSWRDRIDPLLCLDALVDWMDRAPQGETELGEYEAHARNAPLDTLDELARIPFLDPLVVSGWRGTDELEPFPGLVDLLTRGGTQPWQVNVNTAPREVLLALSAGMTEAKVQAILAYRAAHPIRSLDELAEAKIQGIDAGYEDGQTFLGELGPPPGANALSVTTDLFRVDLEALREGRTLARARQCVVRTPEGVNEVDWDLDPIVAGP
ncbi:MAG: type II secretion system minor pseudopilin GspK [Planctomycetes bacterium]|nr:type II secretion system minor pseudopilin GspK [Planctomycetota bacterium]